MREYADWHSGPFTELGGSHDTTAALLIAQGRELQGIRIVLEQMLGLMEEAHAVTGPWIQVEAYDLVREGRITARYETADVNEAITRFCQEFQVEWNPGRLRERTVHTSDEPGTEP